MPVAVPTAASRVSWRTQGVIGLLVFVALTIFAVWREYPPLPRSMALRLTLPKGIPGRHEPIVSAGKFEAADFLVIAYETPTSARFSYDHWGFGGPSSDQFTFEPGRTYAVQLEMPALAEISVFPGTSQGPLRLILDGQEIFRADVSFHYRNAEDIFFGENPIGGNTGGLHFRGAITTTEGRVLRGGPGSYFSWQRRLASWLRSYPWHLVLIAFCSGLLALGAPALVRWCVAPAVPPATRAAGATPHHAWFIGTTLGCVGLFTWVMTGGTWSLFSPEAFAHFYDYQGVSLLHGHLDVPEAALSGEAFVFDGKYYGYFGPTPAILRMPLLLIGVGFGHLSRSFMLLEYTAALAGAYALLCLATNVIAGAGTWPSRWATVVFVAALGIGSTLFFLSSRAYIYHEAILCGAAFTLWSSYGSLRFWRAPDSRWWIVALACGTLAVHARPPIGFFALTLLGTVAAALLVRSRANPSRRSVGRPLLIGALAAAGIASFNGLSYLKFKTIEGCPLRYNVSYSPERLAKIDGRQFHLSNVRFSLDAYLLKPTLGIEGHFPFFYSRGLDRRRYPYAKMDLTEPMAGLPYAMPALFLLTLIGAVAALRSGPATRQTFLLVAIAAIPMTLAMFAAIAVSHRYTADFLGFFAIGGAIGTASLDQLAGTRRRAALAGVSALTLASVAITLGLTLQFQGEVVWGVPNETKENYMRLRERFDHWFPPTPKP